MIQVDVILDAAGLLKSCRLSGHAGAGKKGSDIVCAAVSVLARTTVKVLSEREGITIRGDIPDPGHFYLETEYESDGKEFLAAAGTFLIEGILSISAEYPDNCMINIERRK